jgi:hypothetical protein
VTPTSDEHHDERGQSAPENPDPVLGESEEDDHGAIDE